MQAEVLPAVVLFSIGLIVLEISRRGRLVSDELARKLYLAGLGALAIALGVSGNTSSAPAIYGAIAAVAYLSFRFELLAAIEDAGPSLGSVLLPLSGAALFAWLRDERAFIAVSGMAAGGIGDATAALVGRRTGTRRYRAPSNRRSMEGTLAMFFATGVVLAPVLAVMGELGWHQAVAFALISATVAACTEAVVPFSFDNAVVPLATAGTLAALVSFSQ